MGIRGFLRQDADEALEPLSRAYLKFAVQHRVLFHLFGIAASVASFVFVWSQSSFRTALILLAVVYGLGVLMAVPLIVKARRLRRNRQQR